MKAIDRTGQQFGYWTAVKRTSPGRWLFRCVCGVEKDLRSCNVVCGASRSCGCKALEIAQEFPKENPEYDIWSCMRDRCNNPRNQQWHHYGGRGIKVCDRWDSFRAFLADMGQRPSRGHSLDRRDVNGGYSPDNCRWATQSEQLNNTRRNVRIEHDGRNMTVAEWANETGMKRGVLYRRVHAGLTGAAVFAPIADHMRRAWETRRAG